jgi:hypothetical protein
MLPARVLGPLVSPPTPAAIRAALLTRLAVHALLVMFLLVPFGPAASVFLVLALIANSVVTLEQAGRWRGTGR